MTIRQKFISVMLAIILTLVLLAGCGSSSDTPAVADDPNIGLWQATRAEMFDEEFDARELFDDGFEIELMAGERCVLHTDGTTNTYTWAVQENTLTISTGGVAFIKATIEDDMMVIEDYMENGLRITLQKEGAAADKPVAPDAATASEVGYYVIDSMMIGTAHYDAEALDVLGMRYYIRLNEDHTAEIHTEMRINGTWKDGKIHYQQDGANVVNEYVLNNDTLTIEIEDDGAQATLIFKRSSESAPESAAQTVAQAMWNGEWYGFMWVTDWFEPFETDEEFFVDAYLTIDVGKDGVGTLSILLDGDEDNIMEADIQADENHFEVTDGIFLDMQLDPDGWWIAPSSIDDGKKIVMSDVYVDPESGDAYTFEYMFCFRPSDESWAQEQRAGERMPPGYDLHKDLQSTDEMTGAAHFTSAELKGIYAQLLQDYDDRSLSGQLYQEICDQYFSGIDGALDLEGDTLTIYKWFATDNEEAYVQMSFQDYTGDGNKTAGGVGSYFP